MDDIQQMVVVEGVYLDKEVEVACCVVTFHHFGYPLQLLHHPVEVFRVFEVKANKGTSLIAYLLGINYEFRPLDNTGVRQFLYALVNGSPAHVAGSCHLQERHTCVFCYHSQNLLVKFVNLLVCHFIYFF